MVTYVSKARSKSKADTFNKTQHFTRTSTASASASANSINDAKQLAIELSSKLSTRLALSNINVDINKSSMTEAEQASCSSNTTVGTSSVSTTSAAGAIPWNTDTPILQNSDGTYYQIRGFSLTSLEYAGAIFGPNGYYDFGYFTQDNSGSQYTQYMNGTTNVSPSNGGNPGNSSITLNAYYLMQNIILTLKKVGAGTQASPFSVPMIRIPVTADYWLNGAATSPALNEYVPPYFTNGQANVAFTAAQYQQAILDLINYFNSTWNTSGYGGPITFAIDLHWNYVSQQPQTSGSYPDTTLGNPNYSYSTNSSKQLALPGVCQTDISGGSSGLTLTDNTIAFWKSVSTLLGVDACGEAIGAPMAYTYTGGSPTSYFTKSSTMSALPLAILQNTFFELYNEPVSNRSGGGYAEMYATYVNGGTTLYNGLTYNFTGFGQMYNTIRQTVGALNICIISGSDDYGYMVFDTSSTSSQWDSTTNTINTNTYNGFTTLSDAIVDGAIYLNSSQGAPGGYFPATTFSNVMLNLHPYVGLYSGGNKHPGYYDASYYSSNPTNNLTSSTQIVGFAQIVTALQTQGTNFSMPNPIICTEFGQYDLPWGNWATPSTNPTTYQYSSQYFSVPANTVKLVASQGSTYGLPYYNGNYVDASGNNTAMPGIVGLYEDFKSLNISFCAWACRPNSGGNGFVSTSYNTISWLVGNNNPYFFGWNQDTNAWAAFQPDVITGCQDAFINYQFGETASTPPTYTPTSLPDEKLYLSPISSANQDLNSITAETNYGAMGADFQYLIDNYYNT
jgi:hypothetical protein